MVVTKPLWVAGPDAIDPEWLWAWDGLDFCSVPEVTDWAQNIVPSGNNLTMGPSDIHDVELRATPVGAVWTFDSLNDHLVSDTTEDIGGDEITVAILVRITNDMTRDHRLVSQWVSPRRFLMWMDTGTNDGYAFIVGTEAGINRTGEGVASATLNEFAVVVGTHSIIEGTKLYVDGELVDSDDSNKSPIQSSGSLPFRLGGDETDGDALWGDMGIAYVWDRPLTADQVRSLAEDPYGPVRPATWLAAFAEGSPGPAVDLLADTVLPYS